MEEFHRIAENVVVPAQLALVMFGMGAALAPKDFRRVLENPRGLFLGLALQLVYVPLVALAFVHSFDVGPGWEVGLILVAVCPGGTTSNLFTYFAKGNVPLSVSVTTVSTVASLVTIPVLLTVLAPGDLPSSFTRTMLFDIVVYLLTPLALGMVVHWRFSEDLSRHASKWAVRASVVAIVLVTISATTSGRIQIAEYGAAPPLIILGFALFLVLSVPQICRLTGRYDDETVALTIEVVVRNVGIGLLLSFVFFPGEPAQGHLIYTCLFYSGLSLPCILPMIIRHRRGRSPVLFRSARPRAEEAARNPG